MSFILLGILNSQATGGVVPAPDFLTSAPLWLDAADDTTITESSGSVSQWDNKGTLENFVQATSAEQPSTGVDTLNGRNVISFATGDLMAASTTANWKFMHDGTTFFVAMVLKNGDTADPGGINSLQTTSASSTNGFGLRYDDGSRSDGFVSFVFNSSGSGTTGPVSVNEENFLTANTFQLVTAIIDPDASAADRIDYFVNDTTGSVTNTNTGTPSTGNPRDPLTFDSLQIPTQVAEIIVVSGADATETNRAEVVSYLNSKWSIF